MSARQPTQTARRPSDPTTARPSRRSGQVSRLSERAAERRRPTLIPRVLSPRRLGPMVGGAFALAVCLWVGHPEPNPKPVIDFIEVFSTNMVLVHFDTAPHFQYVLEATDRLSGSQASGGDWFPVFTAPKLPFDNHYIVPDTRSAPHRLYRLKATL